MLKQNEIAVRDSGPLSNVRLDELLLEADIAKKPQRSLVLWIFAILFATFLGLADAVQSYSANLSRGFDLGWGRALLWGLLTWYSFLPFIPLVMKFVAFFPLDQSRWRRSAVFHILAAPVCAALHSAFVVGVYFLLLQSARSLVFFLQYKKFVLIAGFCLGLLIYGTALAIAQATAFYRRYQAGRVRAIYLEAQLVQAQLHALRMQLQPHFLFNTLHSISALQLTDPAGAQKMTVRLADFLRMTLNHTSQQEVCLSQEIDFLQCYLEIERVRFGERLAVTIDIAPDSLSALIPHLILQPIVENAIKHGIAPRSSQGVLEIRSRHEDQRLFLQVRDNGPGIPDDVSRLQTASGVGLANTHARLERLYGHDFQLELHNVQEGGLQVDVVVPFKTAAQNPALAEDQPHA